MKTTMANELADGVATLTFDEPGSPVNTMCAQWQDDLTAAVQQVVQDKDAIRGVVLASAKSTFFAGADLKGTMRLKEEDAPRLFREIEQTKRNFRTLETLGKLWSSPASMAPRWAAAGKWRSLRTIASPSTTRRSGWDCRRSRWASSPAPPASPR